MSVVRTSTQNASGHLEFELWDISVPGPSPLKSSGRLEVEKISIPNIVFSGDLSVVLVRDRLYHVDLDSKPLCITPIYSHLLEDLRPQMVLWLVRHKDLLFLARAESLNLAPREEDNPNEIRESEEGLGTGKDHTDCCSCLQSCPSLGSYACKTCKVFGIDFDICRSCILEGFWCRDRAHVLKAKTAKGNVNTNTLSWEDTHILSVLDLSNATQPSLERVLFSTRMGTYVKSSPTVNIRNEKLLWFMDATHFLEYDFKTGHKVVHAIRNTDQDHVSFISLRATGPYLFIYSVGHPSGDAWTQRNSKEHAEPCASIRSSSYQIENGLNDSAPEPKCMWNYQLQLQGTSDKSETIMTDGTNRAHLACMANNGTIIYQPLSQILVLPAGVTPDLPTESFKPSKGLFEQQTILKLPSTTSGHFTRAQFLSGNYENGTGPRFLLLCPQKQNLLPVKFDFISDDPAEADQDDDTDASSEEEHQERSEKDPSMDDELATQEEMTSHLGEHFELAKGALCQECGTIVRGSKLLNLPSRWEAIPMGKLRNHFSGSQAALSSGDQGPISEEMKGFRIVSRGDDEYEERTGDNNGDSILEPAKWANLNTQSHTSTALKAKETLFEHHRHHPSLEEFAKAIIGGCHLCSLLFGALKISQEVQRKVQSLLNIEGRKIFEATKHTVDSRRTMAHSRISRSSSDNTLISSGDGVEFARDHSGLILRMKTDLSEGKASRGTMCLYQWSIEDTKPRFEAEVDIGLPEELQEINLDTKRSSEQHCKSSDRVKDPVRYTGSKHAMRLARAWLRSCCQFHNCATPGVMTLPPTRVIDVGPPDGTQTPHLYVTSVPKDTSMRYLTLSHCWGSGNQFVLTASNLQGFVAHGFSLDSMPETFRDAVLICRSLHVRYLWIDSLCIIQDGDGGLDWKLEAPQMCTVYGNSLCTLAALSATSVQSGCFAIRNTLSREPLVFSAGNGSRFMVQVLNETDGGFITQTKHHLNSRAWIFQERMLSHRLLGFSSEGISWHCDNLRATDRFYRGVDAKFFSSLDPMTKHLLKQATKPLRQPHVGDEQRRAFLSAWYDLLQEYSDLHLTVPSDKLMAITGVAQVIQRATGFKWYYGLWHDVGNQEMLLSQLLWTCPRPRWDPSAGDSRAPTFSWVSMHPGVDYRTTFHPRYINMEANFQADFRRNSKRNYFWLPHSYEGHIMFFECLLRFGCLTLRGPPSGRTQPLNDPSVKLLLEYRSEILHFMDQSNIVGQAMSEVFPPLILRGHIRSVKLIQIDSTQVLWKYPWTDENKMDIESTTEKGDTSPDTRDAWFWPDKPFSLPEGAQVHCLTVARWQRAWDQRWFCAGIVLQETSLRANVVHGSLNEDALVLTRVGYFEHEWESQTIDWENDGECKIVLLT